MIIIPNMYTLSLHFPKKGKTGYGTYPSFWGQSHRLCHVGLQNPRNKHRQKKSSIRPHVWWFKPLHLWWLNQVTITQITIDPENHIFLNGLMARSMWGVFKKPCVLSLYWYFPQNRPPNIFSWHWPDKSYCNLSKLQVQPSAKPDPVWWGAPRSHSTIVQSCHRSKLVKSEPVKLKLVSILQGKRGPRHHPHSHTRVKTMQSHLGLPDEPCAGAWLVGCPEVSCRRGWTRPAAALSGSGCWSVFVLFA